MTRHVLLAARQAATSLSRLAAHSPLAHVRWTPPQHALLSSTQQRVLLRTGNQFGKTWAGLAETIYRCLGRHPHKAVRAAPIEAWIVTTSWSQSIAIQAKLWELLPKDELHGDTVYDPVKGFRGKNPAIQFRNGSIIRVKTSRQGGLSLASATIDFVLGDEPFASARIYGEIEKRLIRRGGTLVLTLTPINAPCDWLRELAEKGAIEDLHFDMVPENFIPVGEEHPILDGVGKPIDADWIAEVRSRSLPMEEPITCDGEWEMRATDRVFEAFDGTRHAIPNLMASDVRPRVEVELALGLDYGEDRLRTCGALVYIEKLSHAQRLAGERERVWIVGEYVPESASTIDMDAEGVIAMLAAEGLRWSDLDHAHGDKRYTDGAGKLTKKSNKMMLDAIAKATKARGAPRPIIHGAKRGQGRGAGAVWTSARWLHDRMIRPGHFYIDERRCPWLVECLLKWDGTDRSAYKDGIDSIFYALRPWAIRKSLQGGRPQSVVRFG